MWSRHSCLLKKEPLIKLSSNVGQAPQPAKYAGWEACATINIIAFQISPSFAIRGQKCLFQRDNLHFALYFQGYVFQNGLWGRPCPLTMDYFVRKSFHVFEMSQAI